MARIRSKGTEPERLVRSALHGQGLRFRLGGCGLPGKPDLVFRRHRAVVFVHGCFWHQHAGCREGRIPSSRVQYWEPKLLANRKRDMANQRRLRALGWSVFVIWECQLTQGRLLALAERIRKGRRPKAARFERPKASTAAMETHLRSVEICAGAGGQALGLEQAGFEHAALVEIDAVACETLRKNRPSWNVLCCDLRSFSGASLKGVDLLAGGVPCPPFSIAGKQLGADDERDLFPEALRLAAEVQPRAVMLENVPGFAARRFDQYRSDLLERFRVLGFEVGWRVLSAVDFGVPQLRPRFILVGLRPEYEPYFSWPSIFPRVGTVGGILLDLMAENGWEGAEEWSRRANGIAPTLVGGSKKHGGPDLGPTRAKRQWEKLRVDGMGLADGAPAKGTSVFHVPRLTTRMAARLQGFPDSWQFAGKKTAAYRQIGNAFPPPVACAVASAIAQALRREVSPCGGAERPLKSDSQGELWRSGAVGS